MFRLKVPFVKSAHIYTQSRKLSTATAVDALQLAEVPLKLYPYSQTKWPVPSHPPGRGAPSQVL